MIRPVIVSWTVLAAGCLAPQDDGGPWQDATTMVGALAPEHGAPFAATTPGCTIRIATWNVHYGADPDDLATQLRASAELATVDVLLVQEIEAYPDETASRTRRLADALAMTYVYAPARDAADGTHGVAILARHPLAATAVRRLPAYDQPINPRARIALAADIVLGADLLRIVNVHLDVRLGPVDRVRQLDPAIADLDDRAIVGGDFNSNPWAWADGLVPLAETEAIVGQPQAVVLDDYAAALGFSTVIAADTATMRVPVVAIRTDDLYVRDVEARAAGVARVDGSDHWAVWADVDRCGR